MATDVIIDPSTGQIYWNDSAGVGTESISIKGDAVNTISFTGYSGSFSPGSTPAGALTLVTIKDSAGTDALIPGTSGYNLGSSTLRWNTFSTNANLSGTLVVSDTTISSSLLTGSVKFNGGIAISGNASIGQSLNFYNTSNANYVGFKAGVTAANTLYTLPTNFPGSGTSVLQSDTSGTLVWVPMAAGSSSGGTAQNINVVSATTSASHPVLFTPATGTASGAAVSSEPTFVYNPSTDILSVSGLAVTNTTASTSPTTGALVVSGGVGIGASLIISGRVGIGTNLLTSNVNINGSTDILGSTVITAPDNNTKALRILGFSSGTQGDIFSIEHPAGGSFTMASNFAGQAGGRFTIVASGNAQVRGSTFVINASDSKGVLSVDATSNFGILSLNNGTTLRLYNSTGAQYSGFAFTGSTTTLYSLPISDGSSGQFLQTNGVGGLSWATATGSGGTGSSVGVGQGGQYEMAYYPGTGLSVVGSNTFLNNTATGVVSIIHSTASTDTNSGAFKVTGGVGIGGSLYVGGIGASITGVTFSNSTITRGTWNGTAISPTYGGTGLNNSSATGLLQYSSGTASVITTSASLASIISDETGTAGKLVFSTSPVFTTDVTTDSGSFNVFNTTATTINAFGAATTLSVGAATGKFTHNSTDNSSSISTGSLVVLGGAGIAKSVSIGGYLQLFNSTNYTAFVSSASGNTVYTLPATSPATGSSVLQSTSAGVMSWVPMVASSGSGLATTAANININTLGSPNSFHPVLLTPAQSSAGSAVSVNGTLVYNPLSDILHTPGLAVTSGVNATNTTSGAFQVRGGIGITGNAFIGGTINVASTSVSNISNVSFTNGIITSGTWSGSTITAFYGGTGLQGPTAIGDLIVANTATTWSRYATSATSGQVLTSNGTGNAPTWQAVPASAASSVAVAPTVVNASFFVTAVNTSNSSGLGLSTITSFVVNPSNGIVSLSGLAVTNTTASTNTTSGALIVSGGLGLAGNAFIGGTINVASTSASVISGISFVNGAITVGAWNSTVIAPQYGGTGLNNSSATGLLQYSSGTASVITTSSALANIISDDTGSGALVFATSPVLVTPTLGVASATSINKVVFTAPTTSATLTLVDGSTLITAGANSLTLTTTATTNATFPAGTKTLVATDVTSLSSLSTVGVISSGTWSGSTITAFYGGTGLQGPTAIGDLIVANTATTWSRYATSATSGQVLTSNGTGSAPTWQAVPASAASSVAIAPTVVSAQFFIPVVNAASSAGLGLSSVSSLVINPFTGLVSLSGLAVTNTTVSTNTTSGALVVTGGVGIGGSLYTSTGSSSSVSGVILANGNVSATSYNKILLTAPASSATLTLANGSSLITSGGHSLTFTTSNTTSLTLPTTGTLATTDVTSLASLTTASSLNSIGTIGTGVWSATAITSHYGGTGLQSPFVVGDILYATTTTSWGRLAASSTSGQVLTSNGAASLPTWQAVPASAASSVAIAPTVVNTQFFIPVVNAASSAGLGLSSVSSLVINPSTGLVSLSGLAVTNTTVSINASSGALIVTGGAAVGQTLSVGGSLNVFNGANYSGFRYSGSANTTYTLPTNSPQSAVGTSVLTSTTAGVMSWIGMSSGGSGSPGGSNKQIQYNNATAFGGASGFEYTTGGIAVTVSVFSPSGIGYTSGLWVSAIGGTTRVGIGLSNPQYELEILGELSATNKSFVINHPTKSGMKLRYGSLEGPENGVYVRGELKGSNLIEVPDHWLGLVHEDSYTVHLTPINRYAQLYVEKIENYNVYVADNNMNPIHCYYSVWAERKDIPKLVTEYEAQ